jgi:integrase
MEAKNLTAVEPHNDGPAGATELIKADANERIFQFKWWMKKQGKAESTITSRAKLLKIMVKRGAHLYDPESIKEVIAKQETWCSGRKQNAVYAYSSYLQMVEGNWEQPKYRKIRKIPFIPIENEIDQLIAGCNKRITTLLQLLKETGMRIGEAWNLEWTDIDTLDRKIRVTPEKGSNPRIIQVSNKLIDMLSALPKDVKTTKMFSTRTLKSQRRLFNKNRRKIAKKLKNPRITQITFHTFRHWKATMEYHRTKDIIHVMKLLGHKNIKNTLVYTQLMDDHNDRYIVKVSHNIDEDQQYLETGFEYVTDRDGIKIYRKPK